MGSASQTTGHKVLRLCRQSAGTGTTMHWLKVSLLFGAISCAPPIEPDIVVVDVTDSPVYTTIANTESVENVHSDMHDETTEAKKEITTVNPPQQTTPQLSAQERRALISYLSEYDLSAVDPLVLTPRQRVAILQELEHQSLGLAPFTDPTPWQRLSREQQKEFNRKYLALRSDLQEYSRKQFLSLPDDRQEHAFQAFLSVDLQTLSDTIERELLRDRALQLEHIHGHSQQEQQQLVTEQQHIQEQLRQAEQQHLAEEQRLAEQQRLVEQQGLAEQQRLSEQQRLAEQHKLLEQQQLAEKQHLAEQKHISEQKYLSEQQFLADQNYLVTEGPQLVAQRIIETDQKEDVGSDEQDEIDELFEVREQVRSEGGTGINHIANIAGKFEHFQPVEQRTKIRENTLGVTRDNILVQPTTENKQRITSSLRETRRKQKRLNIRRLNFDPRR